MFFRSQSEIFWLTSSEKLEPFFFRFWQMIVQSSQKQLQWVLGYPNSRLSEKKVQTRVRVFSLTNYPKNYQYDVFVHNFKMQIFGAPTLIMNWLRQLLYDGNWFSDRKLTIGRPDYQRNWFFCRFIVVWNKKSIWFDNTNHWIIRKHFLIVVPKWLDDHELTVTG